MSVSNGQAGNQDTFNDAFLSLFNGGNILGLVKLLNPSAGGDINNLQQFLNDLQSELDSANDDISAIEDTLSTLTGGFKIFPTESISSSGEISKSTDKLQIRKVAGNGGAVVASLTPFGSTELVDGAMYVLVGTSDTDTVEIQASDVDYGALINGYIILKKGTVQKLIWDAEMLRFIDANGL